MIPWNTLAFRCSILERAGRLDRLDEPRGEVHPTGLVVLGRRLRQAQPQAGRVHVRPAQAGRPRPVSAHPAAEPVADDVSRTRLRPPGGNHEAGHRAPPSVDPLDARRRQRASMEEPCLADPADARPSSRGYFQLREGARFELDKDIRAADVHLLQSLDLDYGEPAHDRLSRSASNAELRSERPRVEKLGERLIHRQSDTTVELLGCRASSSRQGPGRPPIAPQEGKGRTLVDAKKPARRWSASSLIGTLLRFDEGRSPVLDARIPRATHLSRLPGP